MPRERSDLGRQRPDERILVEEQLGECGQQAELGRDGAREVPAAPREAGCARCREVSDREAVEIVQDLTARRPDGSPGEHVKDVDRTGERGDLRRHVAAHVSVCV